MPRGHEDFVKAIDLAVQTLELLKIQIAAQQVGVKIEAEWQIYKGYQKTIRGGVAGLAAGASSTIIDYTVPSGKEFYMVAQIFIAHPDAVGGSVQPGLYLVAIAGVSVYNVYITPESPTHSIAMAAPFKAVAGDFVRVRVTNFGTASGTFIATIHGYEVAV